MRILMWEHVDPPPLSPNAAFNKLLNELAATAEQGDSAVRAFVVRAVAGGICIITQDDSGNASPTTQDAAAFLQRVAGMAPPASSAAAAADEEAPAFE